MENCDGDRWAAVEHGSGSHGVAVGICGVGTCQRHGVEYVALSAFGSQTIKNGLRPLVDRRDRRDLTLFRIGCDMRQRCLVNDLVFSIRPIPYF